MIKRLVVVFLTLYPPIYPGEIDFNGLHNSANLRFGTATSIGEIVSALLNYVFPLVGLIFLLILIAGGLKMMMSEGDPKKVANAKEGLAAGVVGFLIIFL
jgi:hypothetical protein